MPHDYNITPEEVNQLRRWADTLRAEKSFYEFCKQAWHVVEYSTPFIESWHLQAYTEHLEACFHRKITKLLVNVPPRTSKTTIFSILFPAWVWIHNSELRFMFASYSNSLSMEHSRKCRQLIESPWYRQRWGHKFSLCREQKAKGFFINNRGGYRIATSVGAATTGHGANFLITDDANNVLDGNSDAKREGANKWWDQVWSTRLNDKRHDVKIAVQQRIHEMDLSGHIIANDIENTWVKLILPMEFEKARCAKTIILPSTNGKIWTDPRTIEGELLCPERWTAKELSDSKLELGSYGYAGQYQQRPAPEEGGIIQRSWFKWWKESRLPDILYIVQSWDTALSAKDGSSYSACTTWGVFRDEHYIENIILLSMWRDRVEYPDLRNMAKRLYFDYRDVGKTHNPAFTGISLDMCIIEAKASGDPLIKDLALAGIRAVPFDPKKYGDKIGRVRYVTHLIEAGRVWLPARAPHYVKLLDHADTFLNEVIAFPTTESRDLVDTMTQVLTKLKEGGLLTHPSDPSFEDTNHSRPIKRVY